MKKKSVKENRLIIKMVMCTLYLIIITILFVCSYKLFKEKQSILPFQDVESIENYTYIDISKMSEKFAYYKDTNIGIHFVIEKEDTGRWHTYLIAINEDDYHKYKNIIDYTYERTTKVPKVKRVYGYPVIVNDEIKKYAIKNIANFVPNENEVKITEENYEEYLTNSYLDTTKSKQEKFSIILFSSLLLLFVVIILFFLTIFDKDKIVDKLDEELEKDYEKAKKALKKK